MNKPGVDAAWASGKRASTVTAIGVSDPAGAFHTMRYSCIGLVGLVINGKIAIE
jgi:hypothetical protein